MIVQAQPADEQGIADRLDGRRGVWGETDCMTTEQLALQAEMSNVKVLRQELLRLCRDYHVNEDAAGDLALAVSEAFTNAVRHGTGRPDALIEASIRVSPAECDVSLYYPGNPFQTPPPRLPDCHATGGRGRYLMSVLVDRVQYRFHDGMTEIELHKSWA